MSAPINDAGPAFPVPGLSGLPNGEFFHPEFGMSLRDYFAAKAMQGFAADPQFKGTLETMADLAYVWADAMLKARAA